MPIVRKRVYDAPQSNDGYRVLVDRLWPRGVSKQEAKLDEWLPEIAPTDQLRKWFHADPSRWAEFRRRYLAELKGHRDVIRPLAARAKTKRVTLVYGSNDERHNNAVVVEQYMKMLRAR